MGYEYTYIFNKGEGVLNIDEFIRAVEKGEDPSVAENKVYITTLQFINTAYSSIQYILMYYMIIQKVYF